MVFYTRKYYSALGITTSSTTLDTVRKSLQKTYLFSKKTRSDIQESLISMFSPGRYYCLRKRSLARRTSSPIVRRIPKQSHTKLEPLINVEAARKETFIGIAEVPDLNKRHPHIWIGNMCALDVAITLEKMKAIDPAVFSHWKAKGLLDLHHSNISLIVFARGSISKCPLNVS